MQKRLFVLGFLAILGCASGVVDPRQPAAVAQVQLRSISPPAGVVVTGDTVIVANIEYTLSNFQPSADYYIAPLFASTHGDGQTFNAFDKITEGTRLTAASGKVEVRYGISRELRNSELQHPSRESSVRQNP